MRHDGAVVIALDGSAHSARTLDWGLSEATRRGAPVVLARCYQEPRELTQWGWYPLMADVAFDAEATTYLAEVQAAVGATHPGLQVTTRLLHGPEVPELRTLSEDAQLLVVGARGEGGRGGVGPVAAHLAAHARCSVAVVREVVDTTDVVVGVDGSRSSLEAAQTAAQEARLLDVPLTVLHARPTVAAPYGRTGTLLPPLAGSDDRDPTHRAAVQAAADLRERFTGLDVRLRLVDDDPAYALVEVADSGTLLVVGSRGLGAFRGMLLGSVSHEVVATARTTVLVVHADATDRESRGH